MHSSKLTVLLAFATIVSSVICVEVQLPNGRIRGRTVTTYEGATFYSFQEVPYAAPPVGDLRFKSPAPHANWDGIRNTTKNTKICYQQNSNSDMENEDCLYLNVYTPINPESLDQSVPVLFFIHGGMFSIDSAVYNSYGPDFLVPHGIVVVTTNYRLGPFGFLSTNDSVLPGNYGLKDQNFALKWVNKNIHLFGGDPNKVTLMGQSAGGASVAYHIISKKSKGLFRAAIIQSGSAISSWAYQRHARKIAYQIGAAIDKTFTEDKPSKDLLKLLKSVDAKTIDRAKIPGLSGNRIGKGDDFAPVIEQKSDEAFVTDLMHESLANGDFNKVPLLIGINSQEKITLADNLSSLKTLMAEYDKDLSQIVNADFNVVGTEHNKIVGEAIRALYTDGKFQDDLPASINFHSDVRYTTSVIRHAHLQAAHSDVYFYQFSYDGNMGGIQSYLKGTDGSVAHSENNKYVWRVVLGSYDNTNREKFGEKDKTVSHRFVKIICDFVKELNPTPTQTNLLQNIVWPKGGTDNMQYVDLNDNVEIKTNPKKYKHWKQIYDTYGHPPYDTY